MLFLGSKQKTDFLHILDYKYNLDNDCLLHKLLEYHKLQDRDPYICSVYKQGWRHILGLLYILVYIQCMGFQRAQVDKYMLQLGFFLCILHSLRREMVDKDQWFQVLLELLKLSES